MRSFKTGGATFAEYNTRTLILKYRIQICMVVISLIAYFLLVYSTRHFFGDDLSVTQVAWWDYLLQYGWHGISTLNSHGGDYTTIWYFLIVALEKMWGG
ncbi:MAG: hypothetical protein LBI63_06250, partial [Candidatus Ancillula sp.]|nr:hypothetical protein [Candidatus Ancillula sp.]